MIARCMIGATLSQRDVDAVLVVEGRDRVAVAVQDPGALGERGRLELLGEVLHRPGGGAGAVPDRADERDDQAGDEDAEDRGDRDDDPEVGDDRCRT